MTQANTAMEEKQPRKSERLANALPPSPLTPPRLYEYPLFFLFGLGFLLVLVVFDLLQRAVYPFGPKAHDKVIDWVNVCLAWLPNILGMKLEYIGQYPLDPNRPYIFVSNHQSLIDVPTLSLICPERPVKFISKKELEYGLPTVSFHLRTGRNCIIDRNDAEEAIRIIKDFGAVMEKENFVTVIFPEGTRARDGKLKRFRSSGFLALLERSPRAQIVPVTLDGSWRIQARKFGPAPFGGKIRIVVSPPLEQEKFKNKLDILREAQRIIEENLTKLRTV